MATANLSWLLFSPLWAIEQNFLEDPLSSSFTFANVLMLYYTDYIATQVFGTT